MASAEDTSDQRPPKRSRTTTACQNCRNKKLSCSGGRPCTRCRQDDRECTDVVISERTPLTRKRMTKYEERLVIHERIWSAIFPDLPLSTACDWYADHGLEETIRKIKATCGLSLAQHHDLNQSAQVQKDRNVNIEHRPSIPPIWRRPDIDEPDAQLSSHSTNGVLSEINPVNIPLNLHNVPYNASSAWNEDNLSRGRISTTSITGKDNTGATPGNDFGTGVRADIGYIGMSSAATLLRAIQKFAPEELLDVEYDSNRVCSSTTMLTSANVARITSNPLAEDSGASDPLVLPPYSEIGGLVDAYFTYFHKLTPIVHEPTIRAQIMGAIPLPRNCGSRVLFYMIFATGAFDSAVEDDLGANGMKYYEEARIALQQDLLEGGSLMLVQGLAVMAIWLQRCSKPNAGYVCLGLAIRMATALGLHVSPPSPNMGGLTVLEAELRSRIWWSLVTLEGGQCMTYGRPYGISLPSLTAVRLPVNIDDDRLTVSTSRVPSDVANVTLYTALITQARLAQIAFHSLDQVSRSLPCPTADQIKQSGDRFRTQLDALPTYMQSGAPGPHEFARQVQVWRTRDYQSILYRPVLLSAAWNTNGIASLDGTVQEIINDCRKWAMENLQEIFKLVETDPDPRRGREWYILYFGIQASLTILLSIMWEPDHSSAPQWRESIKNTITWLYRLGSMKELGMTYARIMENVLAHRVDPAIVPPEGPVHAARSGRQPTSTIENYDFERYFSEIWEGQPQFGGMTGDIRLGMPLDVWDDMVTGFENYQ